MSAEAASVATPTPIDLRPLFAPRSVAVVGASARGGIAKTVRDNLRATGSATRCHFVNPRYDELLDQPCYPSIAALPERPDVALVALHPLRAAAAVRDAAGNAVPAVIVPGGGVVEGGPEAAAMQEEVAAIAREHRIALVGPNCMGVWDLTTNTSAYIGDVSPYLPRGGVAGIAQSGSVTDAFIHSGSRTGFSRIIGCGAEAVLDVCDYLAWCLDDPATHAVILFVEGFKRPERFLALADRALDVGKPIIALKVGRSEQAQAAAVAHTGSLAGEVRATDAALDAAGVIRVDDLDELLEAAELVEGCRRTGRRVGRGRTGVVTVSTGEASLIADLAARTRIDLPPIPEATRDALARDLSTMGYVGNPLDPWGAAEPAVAYDAAFRAMASGDAYDVLVLVHDFPYRSLPAEVETARTVLRPLIEATRDRTDLLPVHVSLTSGEPTPEIKQLLDEVGGGAPVLRGAVPAFAAIARVGRWEGRRERRRADGPWRAGWPRLATDRTSWADEAVTAPRAVVDPVVLPERESAALLAAAGVPTSPVAFASTPDEAAAAAVRLGFPAVVKLDALGLAHKSDVGGVRLGLRDAEAVRQAATALLSIPVPGAAPRGLLVQPAAPAGVELIVGVRHDPQFGPVVLVGLGGVFTEVLDDVAVRLAPVPAGEAVAMLGELRGAAVLAGGRGRAPVDARAVGAIAVQLGRLALDRPELIEIDLNPVIAGPSGAVAVDALVVVDRASTGDRTGSRS